MKIKSMGACQGDSERVERDEKGPNTKPQMESMNKKSRESEG